jgi:hypothetical protein
MGEGESTCTAPPEVNDGRDEIVRQAPHRDVAAQVELILKGTL